MLMLLILVADTGGVAAVAVDDVDDVDVADARDVDGADDAAVLADQYDVAEDVDGDVDDGGICIINITIKIIRLIRMRSGIIIIIIIIISSDNMSGSTVNQLLWSARGQPQHQVDKDFYDVAACLFDWRGLTRDSC